MSEPREFWIQRFCDDYGNCHDDVQLTPFPGEGDGGYTHVIEHQAYIKEKEAKERVLRVLKEARYALYRLKIGVKWDENHEWFGEVYKEAEKQLEAGK